MSRSGAVVISYVMKRLNISLEDAELLVRKARPVVCPNEGFRKQLIQFEQFLRTDAKQ